MCARAAQEPLMHIRGKKVSAHFIFIYTQHIQTKSSVCAACGFICAQHKTQCDVEFVCVRWVMRMGEKKRALVSATNAHFLHESRGAVVAAIRRKITNS